jgi:hypothetical protein
MSKPKITIGEIKDKLENIYMGSKLPLSPHMQHVHVEGMRGVIEDILIALNSEYVERQEATK